ncbi:MAG TPA: glycosyltransferase family 2 protein [Gemmatimonadales bacterium]|jgi:glycosyltransferase involved in cell wall biosynthesis|nr:glycosyltransferase family 2 protein [Gemmatimonadales bacterium]
MPATAEPRVAIVMPAYQAAGTVAGVVAGARAIAPVYVVDDGSTDDTGERGRGTGATVLTHATNRGKGAALATGIAAALAAGAEVIVTLDADGQHPPAEIPRLLAPIVDGGADLVLGARERSGAMPLGRRFTNWISARLATRIAGQGVTDAQTGFRAFTRSLAERVRPAGDRYDYETAFLLAACAAGFRVQCVTIPTIYAGAESHFRPWADTWRVMRVFARYARRIVVGAGAA